MISEVISAIIEARSDGKITLHEMFEIMAEIFSVAEDYCRSIIGDQEEFKKVKEDIRSVLIKYLEDDNPNIPNWMERAVEAQMLSLIDPVMDSIWEKVNATS